MDSQSFRTICSSFSTRTRIHTRTRVLLPDTDEIILCSFVAKSLVVHLQRLVVQIDRVRHRRVLRALARMRVCAWMSVQRGLQLDPCNPLRYRTNRSFSHD